MNRSSRTLLLASLLVLPVIASCADTTRRPSPSSDGVEGKLKVAATTSIVGDLVASVGGERIELTTLLPRSADAHTFDPTPADLAAVADANVVFINGLGLEVFLEDLLENADASGKIVSVSDGIEPLRLDPDTHAGEQAGDVHELAEGGNGPGPDPHVWFDPTAVAIWVDNIETALGAADPLGRSDYQHRAELARTDLATLDTWIRQQTEQVPVGRRILASDHLLLAYFAERYGFRIVGAVTPSVSSAADPSARHLRELVDELRDLRVAAIFVDVASSSAVERNIAREVGIDIVPIYTDSLSTEDGPAATYDAFMRFNVDAIVSALLGAPTRTPP